MNKTGWLVTALISVPLALFLVSAIVWERRRARVLLQQWAKANNFLIVQQKARTLFRGPFTWTSTRAQIIYHITVEDKDGNRRSGFVRLGSRRFGIFENEVDVMWEEER